MKRAWKTVPEQEPGEVLGYQVKSHRQAQETGDGCRDENSNPVSGHAVHGRSDDLATSRLQIVHGCLA
jgi:hypothetical protein